MEKKSVKKLLNVAQYVIIGIRFGVVKFERDTIDVWVTFARYKTGLIQVGKSNISNCITELQRGPLQSSWNSL